MSQYYSKTHQFYGFRIFVHYKMEIAGFVQNNKKFQLSISNKKILSVTVKTIFLLTFANKLYTGWDFGPCGFFNSVILTLFIFHFYKFGMKKKTWQYELSVKNFKKFWFFPIITISSITNSLWPYFIFHSTNVTIPYQLSLFYVVYDVSRHLYFVQTLNISWLYSGITTLCPVLYVFISRCHFEYSSPSFLLIYTLPSSFAISTWTSAASKKYRQSSLICFPIFDDFLIYSLCSFWTDICSGSLSWSFVLFLKTLPYTYKTSYADASIIEAFFGNLYCE